MSISTSLQILQDSTRRSLLRVTMEGSKFTRPELDKLYFWFEVKKIVDWTVYMLILLEIEKEGEEGGREEGRERKRGKKM